MLRDILLEIANQVELKGSCSSIVDVVDELAAQKNLYGQRVCISSKTKQPVVRINSQGARRSTNWHEAWYHRDGFIVDPDSVSKVYPSDKYKEECFENSEDLLIELVEES